MRIHPLIRTVQIAALALALAPTGASASVYDFTGKATKLGPVPAAPENQQNSVISLNGLFSVGQDPGDLRAYELDFSKVLYSEGLGAELLLDPKVSMTMCPDVRRSRPNNAVYLLPPGGGSARPTGRATVSKQADGSIKFRVHLNRALIDSCGGACINGDTPPRASITTAFRLNPVSAACGQPIIGGTPVEPQSITVPWKELTDTDGVRLRYTGGNGSGPTTSSGLPNARVTVRDLPLGDGTSWVELDASGSSDVATTYFYQVRERDSGALVAGPEMSSSPTFHTTLPAPGDYVAVLSVMDGEGVLSNPARRGFRLH